jgi:hypothetical protein
MSMPPLVSSMSMPSYAKMQRRGQYISPPLLVGANLFLFLFFPFLCLLDLLTLIPTTLTIYESQYFKAKFIKKSLNKINLKKVANPYVFCLVLLLHTIFLKAILYVLFMVKCEKKSESVTHILVTGDSEESLIFVKFMNCCYFHYLYGPICPTAPPPTTRL